MHGDHPVPLGLAHLEKRDEARDPGIVHEDVPWAELAVHALDGRPDARGARDVGLDRDRAPSERRDLARDRAGPRWIDVQQRDVGAVAREPEGDHPSDAGRAAGHDRVPSGDSHAGSV